MVSCVFFIPAVNLSRLLVINIVTTGFFKGNAGGSKVEDIESKNIFILFLLNNIVSPHSQKAEISSGANVGGKFVPQSESSDSKRTITPLFIFGPGDF